MLKPSDTSDKHPAPSKQWRVQQEEPNNAKIRQVSALSQKKDSMLLLAHLMTVAQKTDVCKALPSPQTTG